MSEHSRASDLATEPTSPAADADGAGLADLSVAVAERERARAAERDYRPALWKCILAIPMLLITIVLGLAAGVMWALALIHLVSNGLAIGVAFDTRTAQYTLGGSLGEILIGIALAALASTQNRVRRRFLRSPVKAER